MYNKYLKGCLTFLSIREMQTKITLRFLLTTVRMASIRKQRLLRLWGRRRLIHCWWEYKVSMEINMEVSQKTNSRNHI